jgi:hypothetical protein
MIKIINVLVIITLLTQFTSNFFSQKKLVYEKRIEFENGEDVTVKTLNLIGEEGVLVVTEPSDQKRVQNRTFTIRKYNTSLEEVKQTTIDVPFKYYRTMSSVSEGFVYDMYIELVKNNVMVFETNVKTLETRNVTSSFPKNTSFKRLYFDEFIVVDDVVYIVATTSRYFKSDEQVLFTLNFTSKEKKITPIFFKEYSGYSSKILSIKQVFNSKDVEVLVKVEKKKEKEVVVLTFDEKGEKKGYYIFTENLDKNISSLSGTKTGPSEYVYTGTYTSRNNSSSEGIFISKTNGSKVEYINFINFLDLENFTSYMSQRKQEKIEKKKKKKSSKGKELTISYKVASHPLIKTDDGYIYLGECYYATYRTESYTTAGPNGTTITQTRQVFDGYQYTHALIVRYDNNGNKIWDEIFDMFVHQKPFTEKRFIRIAEEKQDAVKLAYSTFKFIKSKVIDWNGNIISEEDSEEIETGIEGDKTKRSYVEMDYWYGNYFLLYGDQTIKNKEESKKDDDVKRKRNVYFLSKIKF